MFTLTNATVFQGILFMVASIKFTLNCYNVMNVSLITYLHNIIPFTHHNIPYGNVKKLVILAMSSFNIFFY